MRAFSLLRPAAVALLLLFCLAFLADAAKDALSANALAAQTFVTEQIAALRPSDCLEGRKLLKGAERTHTDRLGQMHALHRFLAVRGQKLQHLDTSAAATASIEFRSCAILALQQTTQLRSSSGKGDKASTHLHATSWNYLATALQSAHAPSADVSLAFNEARRLVGAVSPFVAAWDVLGPFVHGKTELDGDALEGMYPAAADGTDQRSDIELAELDRGNRSVLYSSEVPDGGVVRWRELLTPLNAQGQPGGVSLNFPGVRWNDIAQSVSMAALETQAWLVGVIHAHKSGRVSAHCRGITHFSIDGVPLVGDQYNKEIVQGALVLARGPHIVRIRARSKVQSQLACNFAAVTEKNALRLFAPSALPDLVDFSMLAPWIAVPVLNLSPHWLRELTFAAPAGSIVEVAPLQDQSLVARALHTLPSVAPGQISYVPVRLQLKGTARLTRCPPPLTLSLTAAATGSKGVKVQLASNSVSIHLRCSQFSLQHKISALSMCRAHAFVLRLCCCREGVW